MGEWIVPMRERGSSHAFDLNFLWHSERLYVMDNHRAALWCWLQHLPGAQQWQLFHVDRHYDTLRSRLDQWLALFPTGPTTLQEYLSLSQSIGGISCPVVSWDNYLSIFLARNGDKLSRALFATAREGDRPQHPNLEEFDPWAALDQFERIAEEPDESWNEPPWIVNIDLDFFTARRSDRAGPLRVFDDAYVAMMGKYVADGLRRKRIGCATIALSPETTGSWPLAERLMAVFLADWGDSPVLSAN